MAVGAESFGEWSGLNRLLGRPPTGIDVLLQIHQYDLFEQAAAETAGQRGDAALRKLSMSESDVAQTRDDRLAELSQRPNLNVKLSEEPSYCVSGRLAGLQGSVGASYVHMYYDDQLAEQQSAISLLQRYIAKPDNADVKKFAVELMPALQAELNAVKTASIDSAAK
jgi:predicted outer membrane protein